MRPAGEIGHGALEGARQLVERDAEALGFLSEAQLDELLEAVWWEGGERAVRAHEVGEDLPGAVVEVRPPGHQTSVIRPRASRASRGQRAFAERARGRR